MKKSVRINLIPTRTDFGLDAPKKPGRWQKTYHPAHPSILSRIPPLVAPRSSGPSTSVLELGPVQKTIFDDRFLTPTLLLIKTSSISLHLTDAFPDRLSVSILSKHHNTTNTNINTKHGVHGTTTTALLPNPNIDRPLS